MKCPICRAEVRVATFKRPVYSDPRIGVVSKPEPFRYVQDAECANGHQLWLRDGDHLEHEHEWLDVSTVEQGPGTSFVCGIEGCGATRVEPAREAAPSPRRPG